MVELPYTPEQDRLLAIMQDMTFSIEERAQAANELAGSGDPRPGVGLRGDGVPDIRWCEVPGSDQGRPPVKIGGDRKAYQTLRLQTIDIPTFWIVRYPITNCQFQAFVDDNGYQNEAWWQAEDDRVEYYQSFKTANHPRSDISWAAAMAFCRWLSAKVGYLVRLPTEEEWEKAARGEDRRLYPWGDEYIIGYANVDEVNHRVGPHYLMQTSPVGIYPPEAASPYGVVDMAGNVSEWTVSAMDLKDKLAEQESGLILHSMVWRVVRGGCWRLGPRSARAATRASGGFPVPRHVGLRVVTDHIPLLSK